MKTKILSVELETGRHFEVYRDEGELRIRYSVYPDDYAYDLAIEDFEEALREQETLIYRRQRWG